jgi:P27 family predicted phage terminase small subunit
MGRRGPAPTPTAVKLLQGETRPSRLNFREPLPRRSLPRPPADLDPAARAIWRRTLREMPAGLITALDGDVLACYCGAVVRYRAAASLVARSAPRIRGARSGDVIANPADRVARGWSDQIRLLARELGLTPSARAGLHMEITPVNATLEASIGLAPRFLVRREAGNDV